MSSAPDAPSTETAADAPTASSASIVLIVSRRMRAPLVTLILVYTISVFGLAVIPGVDGDGAPTGPLSLFHSLYVVSYTATTIGFGELPGVFSNAQRMWIVLVIHLTVIGWTYSILTLIALFQDPAFQRAIAAIRFGRRVRRLGEPFVLVIGCGDTGQRLIRMLDRADRRFVVVEKSDFRISELELEDFRTDAPVIVGDGRSPQTLVHAGIAHRNCEAVIALTNDDRANLAVAATARLLNPRLRVLSRVHTPAVAENLRVFGTDHVIDPFVTFASHLLLAMRAPGAYRLLRWLGAAPGTRLSREHEPPAGTWVICGFGRFGKAVREALAAEGVPTRVIDPTPPGAEGGQHSHPMSSWTASAFAAHPEATLAAAADDHILGFGSEREVLERAGLADAAGLIAGTDDDIANLAIIAMSNRINPKLFTVIRQNESVNEVLFDRIRADLVVRPSELVAEVALARLSTPHLADFLDEVRRQNDAWADEVIHQLRKRIGTGAPRTWTVRLDDDEAPAFTATQSDEAQTITLGTLCRDPRDRDETLALRALLLVRNGGRILLPGNDEPLQVGDSILFAGRSAARRQLEYSLWNPSALTYLVSGRESAGRRR